MTSSRRALVCLAAVLSLAACGTTTPLTSTASVGGGTGANSPLGGTTSGGLVSSSTGSTGTTGSVPQPGGGAALGTTGVVAPGAAATQGPVAGGTTTGGAATRAVPEKGPGWDKGTVHVGVLTVNDLHTVAAGLGIEVDPGDLGADANAVAKHLNKRGGILGRKVVIDLYDTKTAEVATNPDSVATRACAHFTQDVRVAVLFNPVTTLDTGNFRACFAKARIPVFSAGSAMLDTESTRGIEGLYFQTAMVAWDKLAPVLVPRLKAQGWFGGWNARLGRADSSKPKLGILVSDTPAGTRVAGHLRKALAAAGYPGALDYKWAKASDGQSASVNYFSGNGVTHIIVADLELTAFQNAAQNQQYKPRYGVSSYNDPYTNLETLSPKGANNGAMGIGWAPAYDVSDQNDPGSTGTGLQRCLALQKEAGQSFNGKRTAKLFALATCDSILLALEGAQAARGFDAASIYAGALRISPTFSTAVSFGNSALTPSHLFTPSSARDLRWFTECECFRYTSKTATSRF